MSYCQVVGYTIDEIKKFIQVALANRSQINRYYEDYIMPCLEEVESELAQGVGSSQQNNQNVNSNSSPATQPGVNSVISGNIGINQDPSKPNIFRLISYDMKYMYYGGSGARRS